MKAEQQQEFIKQLNENQRVIHKICKIYMEQSQRPRRPFSGDCNSALESLS